MIKTVLVVCIGNICRSPMAEGLLKQALPEAHIVSAGLAALSGHAADPHAVNLMREQGLDISRHRAQQFTRVMATQADLILVMDNAQRQSIQDMYPATTGKVFCLGRFGVFDVPDPYLDARPAFEYALQLIQRGVESWVPRIQAIRQQTLS